MSNCGTNPGHSFALVYPSPAPVSKTDLPKVVGTLLCALWRILSFCCVTLCCFNSEIHINTVVLHLFCKRQGQLGLHWCHWGSCLQADVGQQCWWTLPSVFLLHVAVSLLRRVRWTRRKRHKTSGFRNWSCSSFLRMNWCVRLAEAKRIRKFRHGLQVFRKLEHQ